MENSTTHFWNHKDLFYPNIYQHLIKMNYENLNQFMSFIQSKVKIVRTGVLYDALRHDQRVKKFLEIKKLRKDPLYDYSHKGIIKGKGSLVVVEPSDLQSVIDSFFMYHKA